MPYVPLPWRAVSTMGVAGMPVDVANDFTAPGFYGGFDQTMHEYNPNYPTQYINFNGFPYTDSPMYAGFLTGYLPPAKPSKQHPEKGLANKNKGYYK